MNTNYITAEYDTKKSCDQIKGKNEKKNNMEWPREGTSLQLWIQRQDTLLLSRTVLNFVHKF